MIGLAPAFFASTDVSFNALPSFLESRPASLFVQLAAVPLDSSRRRSMLIRISTSTTAICSTSSLEQGVQSILHVCFAHVVTHRGHRLSSLSVVRAKNMDATQQPPIW